MGATDLNVGLDLSRSSWGLCNSSGSLAILDPSLPILTEQLGVFRDYRAHFEPIFFKFCGVCDFVFSNEIGCRKITQFRGSARNLVDVVNRAALFDHLVGAGNQRLGYGDAERLGSSLVDY
jgi:hypothetical protein